MNTYDVNVRVVPPPNAPPKTINATLEVYAKDLPTAILIVGELFITRFEITSINRR